MTSGASLPFGARSVSFGLYTHGLAPERGIEELIEQARLAAEVGFDGVTLSEHHAGYPGYVPNPLQVAGWSLSEMPGGWAAAMPMLLSLRPPTLIAEEAAWLAARFPGRLGIGFASGYVEDDFRAAGASFADRHVNFRAGLVALHDALRRPGPVLARDPAIAAFGESIPLIVAAKGPRALELSAELGMGIAGTAHWDEPTADIHRKYQQFGGRGPRLIRRWVWLGGSRPDAADDWVEQASAPAGDYSWVDPGSRRILHHEDPSELAATILQSFVASEATALSLRVHVPGIGPEEVREQIAGLGERLLPELRQQLESIPLQVT